MRPTCSVSGFEISRPKDSNSRAGHQSFRPSRDCKPLLAVIQVSMVWRHTLHHRLLVHQDLCQWISVGCQLAAEEIVEATSRQGSSNDGDQDRKTEIKIKADFRPVVLGPIVWKGVVYSRLKWHMYLDCSQESGGPGGGQSTWLSWRDKKRWRALGPVWLEFFLYVHLLTLMEMGKSGSVLKAWTGILSVPFWTKPTVQNFEIGGANTQTHHTGYGVAYS